MQYFNKGVNQYLIMASHNTKVKKSNSIAIPLFSLLNSYWGYVIITLALGSQPKQGLAKVQAKSEAQESHFMFLRV
jgi:hypothetical protein